MNKEEVQKFPSSETNSASQTPEQSSSASPCCSSPRCSKTLLIPLIVTIFLTVLVVGYWAGTKKVIASQVPPASSQITHYPTPTPDPTANWKTHASKNYGYSIKYPTSVELIDCEDEGVCNWLFQLKNKDLLITFSTAGLPKSRMIEDYVMWGFCHTNKEEVEQEKINSITFYRNSEVYSENNICLAAVAKLDMGDENSYWVADVQAKAYNQNGISLFDQILSTFRFD